MEFPALQGLGLQPGEPLLYARLLAAVDEGRLLPCHLTNQLIVEMKELVLVQDSCRSKAVVIEKITVKQFCHVLAMVANKVKYQGEGDVEKKVRLALWRVEKLKKLGEAVVSGAVVATDPWPQFRRTFPLVEEVVVVQEEVEEEAEGEKSATEEKGNQSADEAIHPGVDDDGLPHVRGGEKRAAGGGRAARGGEAKLRRLACQPVPDHLAHLATAGLQGATAGEVAARLAEWRPRQEEFVNGIVVELVREYRDPAVMRALVNCVAALLEVRPEKNDKTLRDKVKKYFYMTEERVVAAGQDLSAPWLYLALMWEGGALYDPALYHTGGLLNQLAARVEAWGLNTAAVCDNTGCKELGDFLACQVIYVMPSLLQGCLVRRYCSPGCREEAWGGHREECPSMVGMVFGEAVFPTPPMVTKKEHTIHLNRIRGMYEQEKEKRVGAEAKLEEIEDKFEKLKESEEEKEAKVKVLSEEVAKLKYVKAGSKSAIARLKKSKKEEEMKVVEVGTQTSLQMDPQVRLTLVRMARVELPHLPHLEVLQGRLLLAAAEGGGGRPYGEPLYVRVPSSREVLEADRVGGSALLKRAHLTMDFTRLVRCS